MKKLYIYILYACAWMLMACSDHEGSDVLLLDGDVPIQFTTDVEWLDTRASASNIANTDALKNLGEGFGVFAYKTGSDDIANANFSSKWEEATAGLTGTEAAYPVPDFMYNQQVTWGIQYVKDTSDPDHPVVERNWVYEPPKYWPNSSANATPRHISFFAYAPYTAEGATTEVTGFPTEVNKSPHIDYTMGEPGNSIDLLWANCIDATRNGNGLIEVNEDGTIRKYQDVPLRFHHALARADVYVQRIYDEPTYSGKKPDSEEHTKLFVSQLVLDSGTDASKAFSGSGTLNLETGVWTEQSAIAATEGKYLRTYGETILNDTIGGTLQPTLSYIRARELDKWGLIYDSQTKEWVERSTITAEEWGDPSNTDRWSDSYGVTDVEHLLFADDSPLILLPQTLTLTPTLTYSMVTRDNELLLSDLTDTDGNKYSRIVNTITGNPVTLTFEAGKRYKLIIHIGVEHIDFEAVSVVDWDFPMRFTPGIVEDYKDEEQHHTINEN